MKHLLSHCTKKLIGTIVLSIAVALPLSLSAGHTKGPSDEDSRSSNKRPSARLQHVLDSIVDINHVSNAALYVEVGIPPASFQDLSASFVFQGSSGQAHQKLGAAMTPQQPFRIASATKTMTAVIVLQLVEAGYVSLDTRLDEIFTDSDMPAGHRVTDLHVLEGVPRGHQITVRQLLNHTSRLADYLSYNNDTADGPDLLEVVEELRHTLRLQKLRPPYVLVGHSLGGGNVELYAKLYPEEVAGVVFVDPLPAGFSHVCTQNLGLEGCDVPEAVLATLPDVIRAEYLGFKETEQLIASLGGFGDTPVIVLGRTQPVDTPEELAVLTLRQDMLQAMAAQSIKGRYIAVPGAGHFIQHDAPEVVIQSIQQLVMDVRD